MNFLAIATIAYFVIALEIILDKFLLSSKKVSHPVIYAFYSGVMTAFVLFLTPFPIFHIVGSEQIIGRLVTGIIFTFGFMTLFFAINKSEASRVMPVVGAVIPITTLLLSMFFLNENLNHWQIAGVFILIAGGLLISFDIPFKVNKKKFFKGFYLSILAGVLLAIEVTAFKAFSDHDTFWNVFIWTRFGVVIGAFILLLFPIWRRDIFNSFSHSNRKDKENHKTGALFVFNKILGGVGSILTKKAIVLGSVTIVSALVSVQYVFILILGLIFSLRFPKIFQEKEDVGNIVQKVISIMIISLGIVLISLKNKI